MAPPRFQCLNAMRQIVKKSSGLRAAFSTSQISRADDPPPSRSSSAANDLLALGDSPSSTYTPSSPFSSYNSQLFTNPIQISKLQKGLRPGNSSSTNRTVTLLRESERRKEARKRSRASTDVEELQRHNLSADLSKQISRRWKAGDVYAPHDLSEVETAKWKKRERPLHDVFDVLDLNPLAHYRNFSIMSEYMTPMGRIKHSKETGLRPVNQRRIAKAIRRTIGIGLMPSVHRHPELLYKSTTRENRQLSPSRIPPL